MLLFTYTYLPHPRYRRNDTHKTSFKRECEVGVHVGSMFGQFSSELFLCTLAFTMDNDTQINAKKRNVYVQSIRRPESLIPP